MQSGYEIRKVTLMKDNTCKSCGSEILWRNTAKGIPHPIDPIPHEYGGNIVIQGDTCHVLTVAELTTLAAGTPRYMSHFASCPSANKHRKKDSGRSVVAVCTKCGNGSEDVPHEKYCPKGDDPQGKNSHYWKPKPPQEKPEMKPEPTALIPETTTPEQGTPVEATKPKKRMLSDELAAMSKIDRILSSLPDSTRQRVLRWLGDPSRLL